MNISDLPYKFQHVWAEAESGTFLTNPIPDTAPGGAASQQLGFPPITALPIGAGGIPPNIADFNGFGFYVTSWDRWQQAGGPIQYDAGFSAFIGGYPLGARLLSTNGPFEWESAIDNNTSDPDAGGSNWQNLQSFSSSGQFVTSRFIGVVYTNTAGVPKFVSVCVTSGSVGKTDIQFFMNGVAVAESHNPDPSTGMFVCGMVPAGATYEVTDTLGSGTITSWVEVF